MAPPWPCTGMRPSSRVIRRSSRVTASELVGRSLRGRRSREHGPGDELFEVAVVPPVQLERLGPAEVELDVELDREPNAAEDLYGGGRDVAECPARIELRHRRELRRIATLGPCPGCFPGHRLRAVDGGRGVGQIVRERLKGAERLVELLPGLGI